MSTAMWQQNYTSDEMDVRIMTPDEKQKERNRLTQLYLELDKKYDSAKGKRAIKTIIAFAIAYTAIFWIAKHPLAPLDILEFFVVSLLLSSIHFLISATVFSQLINMSNREKNYLEEIRKQIAQLDEYSAK